MHVSPNQRSEQEPTDGDESSTHDESTDGQKLAAVRRSKKRKLLSYLASRASSSKATNSDIAEYREALKEREEYLIKERRRKNAAEIS